MFSSGGPSVWFLTRYDGEVNLSETQRTLMDAVLSVLGDDGYPYGMPMNHWYCEAEGKLYFHSGMKGHRNPRKTSRDLLQHVSRPHSPTMAREQ